MSIWNLSNGKSAQEVAETQGASFEMNTKFMPLPDKSWHNAICTGGKWDEYEDEEFIQLDWSIIGAELPFENRKVFQKIKVNAEKDTSRDNAIKMLIALNTLAGAELLEIANPTDDDLDEAFNGTVCAIRTDLWVINDNFGNFVGAVAEQLDEDDEALQVDTYNAQMEKTLARLKKAGIDPTDESGKDKKAGKDKKTNAKPNKSAKSSGTKKGNYF